MNENYDYLDEVQLHDMITYLEKEELEVQAKITLLRAEILVREIDKENAHELLSNLQSELNAVNEALNNKKENA